MQCSSCGKENDTDAKFCVHCGKPLTPTMRGGSGGGGITQQAQQIQPTTGPAGKNPTVAVILSLFLPGAGQFYNGDMKKGAVMLVLAIVLMLTVVGYLGMVVWSAIDAYNVASGKGKPW